MLRSSGIADKVRVCKAFGTFSAICNCVGLLL